MFGVYIIITKGVIAMVTVLCSLLEQVPSCRLVAPLGATLVRLILLLHGKEGRREGEKERGTERGREGVEGIYLVSFPYPMCTCMKEGLESPPSFLHAHVSLGMYYVRTVETLIKDTQNKGHLSIKDTCLIRCCV